jgi:hypothetical protein
MGRNIVEIVIELFYILPMVSFLIAKTKEPLLQDGVFPVPKANGETKVLKKVGDTPKPVLSPMIGPAMRMIIREIMPCIAIRAIIFPDRSPLSLT